MRILLVSPHSDDDHFSTAHKGMPKLSSAARGKRVALFPPYSLLTIGGLTPPEHEVQLHDEHVRGRVDSLLARERYDIVGISTLTNQLKRTTELAAQCKAQGVPGVVAGGAGTVRLPQAVREELDAVFLGEAEYTWPRFLEEFAQRRHQRVYRQVSKVDVADTPVPRWDLVRDDLKCYWAGAVQTNRGCPHECAFCDSIYIYGRRCRTRPLERVLTEIRTLAEMGAKAVMIADDNFVGDRRYVKQLLRELVTLNNSFDSPLAFMTQADVTIARDEELLELMADSNFVEIVVGIESSQPGALRCLNKTHSLGLDVAEAVRKIQSYGLPVLTTLIAGTDVDDVSVFEKARAFLREANVADHALWPLMAPGGTRLWYQLKRERRLVRLHGKARDRLGIVTNIIPKQMSRVEFFNALADYWDEAFDPDGFAERAIALVRSVRRRPNVKRSKLRLLGRHWRMMFRVVLFYLFRAPRPVRRAFFRVFRVTRREAPFMLPKMMLVQMSYMMGRNRGPIAAKLAREQARWEQEHPDEIEMLDARLPIPDRVREQADEIIGHVYRCVRGRIPGGEAAYQSCLAAFVEFVCTYGDEFDELDDQCRANVAACCERTFVECEWAERDAGASALPTDHPPRGFAREILDAADFDLRLRQARSATAGGAA